MKTWNRFAALENLNDSKGKNRSLENIEDSITTSAKQSLGMYEL